MRVQWYHEYDFVFSLLFNPKLNNSVERLCQTVDDWEYRMISLYKYYNSIYFCLSTHWLWLSLVHCSQENVPTYPPPPLITSKQVPISYNLASAQHQHHQGHSYPLSPGYHNTGGTRAPVDAEGHNAAHG